MNQLRAARSSEPCVRGCRQQSVSSARCSRGSLRAICRQRDSEICVKRCQRVQQALRATESSASLQRQCLCTVTFPWQADDATATLSQDPLMHGMQMETCPMHSGHAYTAAEGSGACQGSLAAWPEARPQLVSIPHNRQAQITLCGAESCSCTGCPCSNREVLDVGASVHGP